MKLFPLALIAIAQSLYFEISEKDKKCFIEELPDDTQMIGKYLVQIFDKADKVSTVVFGQADTSLCGQNLRIFSKNPV